jgi:type I site-specific restriction endonuclease
MSANNLDDILMTQKTVSQPHAPEESFTGDEETTQESEVVEAKQTEEEPLTQETSKEETETNADTKQNKEETASQAEPEVDEYGNLAPKTEQKTYTQDEVDQQINRAIRERLSRLERNHPGAQQMQDQMKNFQVDEKSSQTWQQQLEAFIEQTYEKMLIRQAQEMHRNQEQINNMEFEKRFHKGMEKFSNFQEVVSKANITDSMVKATRQMQDPAAFFYAAATRAPQELDRIARIPDEYAQAMEIGKLEVSLRQTKNITKTPRPIAKTPEDATIKSEPKQKKEKTLDDLLAEDMARRLAQKRRGYK